LIGCCNALEPRILTLKFEQPSCGSDHVLVSRHSTALIVVSWLTCHVWSIVADLVIGEGESLLWSVTQNSCTELAVNSLTMSYFSFCLRYISHSLHGNRNHPNLPKPSGMVCSFGYKHQFQEGSVPSWDADYAKDRSDRTDRRPGICRGGG
jgi:hypothetical protein